LSENAEVKLKKIREVLDKISVELAEARRILRGEKLD
jgi:hypothetical protein